MEEKIIDCTKIHTKEDLHRIFQQTLSFPEWYGSNLDALHDCLMELQDVELVLIGWPDEGYLSRVRRVMVDAAWENETLALNNPLNTAVELSKPSFQNYFSFKIKTARFSFDKTLP